MRRVSSPATGAPSKRNTPEIAAISASPHDRSKDIAWPDHGDVEGKWRAPAVASSWNAAKMLSGHVAQHVSRPSKPRCRPHRWRTAAQPTGSYPVIIPIPPHELRYPLLHLHL